MASAVFSSGVLLANTECGVEEEVAGAPQSLKLFLFKINDKNEQTFSSILM